jgi:ribosomal protein L37E
MRSILRKVRFLIFCLYKGHRFGVTKYLNDGEMTVCARCGYGRKRKYKRPPYHSDDCIY